MQGRLPFVDRGGIGAGVEVTALHVPLQACGQVAHAAQGGRGQVRAQPVFGQGFCRGGPTAISLRPARSRASPRSRSASKKAATANRDGNRMPSILPGGLRSRGPVRERHGDQFDHGPMQERPVTQKGLGVGAE